MFTKILLVVRRKYLDVCNYELILCECVWLYLSADDDVACNFELGRKRSEVKIARSEAKQTTAEADHRSVKLKCKQGRRRWSLCLDLRKEVHCGNYIWTVLFSPWKDEGFSSSLLCFKKERDGKELFLDIHRFHLFMCQSVGSQLPSKHEGIENAIDKVRTETRVKCWVSGITVFWRGSLWFVRVDASLNSFVSGMRWKEDE